MNKTIERIETLKKYLHICNKFLLKRNISIDFENALVATCKELKKDIRELQVSKPIEGLKG